MSVINKMLRDIEQRSNSSGSVNSIIVRQSGQPLWLTLLLLFTLLLLGFAVYAVLNRNATVSAGSVFVAVAEPAAVAGVTNAEVPAAIASTALDIAVEQAAIVITAVAEVPAQATILTAPVDNAELSAMVAKPVARDVAAVIPEQQENVPITPAVQVTAKPRLSVVSNEPTAAQRQAKLRQQALAAAQAGQRQQALHYWQQLQQLTPQDSQVYLAQARLWLQLGQPQQAEASLLQAKVQGVLDADIQLMLAQAAASRQQWSQVDELLPAQFTVALYPDYYGLKATALQQLGQHQQALNWFAELSSLQPRLGKWWLGGAVSLEALTRPAEAHQYYRNALQWGDSLSVQSRTYIQQRLAATE